MKGREKEREREEETEKFFLVKALY